MQMIRPLLFLSLMVLSTAVPAQTAPPQVVAEVRQWLTRGEFTQLDQRYGQIQRDYASGKLSEVQLRDAFRVFYVTDPDLEKAYAEWVSHSPESYVAHLARGIYYRFLGVQRRGTKSSSNTSARQLAALRSAHEASARELDISLSLEAKPLLSFHNYLEICQYRGDAACARRMFERGVAIAPKTVILREKYMATLMTKWGGSTDLMRAFAEESRAAGLGAGEMARLHSLVREDEGWVHQFRGGDAGAAADSYRQSALLNPSRACQGCGPNARRARILMEQGEHAKAVDLASQVLRESPNDVEMLTVRGYSYVKLRQGSKAHADLVRVAQQGDAWAQTMVAKILLTGDLLPIDRPQAIRWLELAAKQNHAEAVEILPRARNPNQVIRFRW
jgi:TPR repeat protein